MSNMVARGCVCVCGITKNISTLPQDLFISSVFSMQDTKDAQIPQSDFRSETHIITFGERNSGKSRVLNRCFLPWGILGICPLFPTRKPLRINFVSLETCTEGVSLRFFLDKIKPKRAYQIPHELYQSDKFILTTYPRNKRQLDPRALYQLEFSNRPNPKVLITDLPGLLSCSEDDSDASQMAERITAHYA